MRLWPYSKSARPPSGISPDAEVVRKLAALLTETGLCLIEYGVGNHSIRVARDAPAANCETPANAPEVALSAVPSAQADQQSETEDPNVIRSPYVGFVHRLKTDGTLFVQSGDEVEEGRTLLEVEVLGTMWPIKAPRRGVIIHVYPAIVIKRDERYEEVVEYGTLLFDLA